METPLTIRTNNPGALRPTKDVWVGQTGKTAGAKGEFLTFESPVYGVRAYFKNAKTQIKRGNNTVKKFISIYAPQIENNTDFYISEVASVLGSPDTVLNFEDKKQMIALAKIIFSVEAGKRSGWEKTYTDAIIEKGYNMATETTTTPAPGKPKEDPKSGKMIYLIYIAVALFLIFKFAK